MRTTYTRKTTNVEFGAVQERANLVDFKNAPK